MTWTCPYGGCDAFGYCPCAEDDAELEDQEPDEDFDDYVTVRYIEDLPDISNYRPTQGS